MKINLDYSPYLFWNKPKLREKFNKTEDNTFEDKKTLSDPSSTLRKDLEDPYPDPASEGVYDWIENQLEKAGVNIEGNFPWGAKAVGKGIEMQLYRSLSNAVFDYVESLSENAMEGEVIEGVRKAVEAWSVVNFPIANQAFEQLFRKGFRAGVVSTGKMGTFDEQALEVVKQGRYQIGERIKLFGDEAISKFADIVSDSYTADGVFSLESLIMKMNKAVPSQRFALERIARTETSNVSMLGRISGWDQDEDKYTYDYLWSHANDNRVREMKKIRRSWNPLTFDEVVFLWTHNKQLLPSGNWEMGIINCRCSITRTPRDDENRGFRFKGREQMFEKTVDFDVSILASVMES